MKKEVNKKDADVKKTNSTEFEWTIPKIASYIGYLYTQNEHLWAEVISLGSAVNQLQAKAKGEY